MTQEQQQTKCPKFDFHFRGKCINNNCMLWHRNEEASKVNCLAVDSGVSDGLSYTHAKNSRLLMQLSASDDPKVQLETSKILLQLTMVLALNISQFEELDYALCECGARKTACNKNGACKTRRDWFEWLSKLFQPVTKLNSNLSKAELNHIYISTLLQFHKTDRLPPFIENALPSLGLSKRIV